MKNVLFATTALIATASVAAADVSFGGYGRFGAIYNGTDTRIESRLRLIITGTAESDNGLSFGTQIRYEVNENSTSTFNAPRFWVSTGGLTVSVGQVLGAVEVMPGRASGIVGLTGLGFMNFANNHGSIDGYSSGGLGTQGVDVIYKSGDFGVHLSHSVAKASGSTTSNSNSRTAIVGSYKTSGYTFAAGFQDSSAATDLDWILTASGTFGAASLTAMYADHGTAGAKYGVGGSVKAGAATTVTGYLNHSDATGDNYGIGVSHALGGGTFVKAGIVSNGGTTMADAGLHFNF